MWGIPIIDSLIQGVEMLEELDGVKHSKFTMNQDLIYVPMIALQE